MVDDTFVRPKNKIPFYHIPRSGPVTLDSVLLVAAVDGVEVALTRMEFAILELLLLQSGIPLLKKAIIGKLYGKGSEPHSRVIDVLVFRLRKKLAEHGADNLIGAVRGRGYVIRSDRSD